MGEGGQGGKIGGVVVVVVVEEEEEEMGDGGPRRLREWLLLGLDMMIWS